MSNFGWLAAVTVISSEVTKLIIGFISPNNQTQRLSSISLTIEHRANHYSRSKAVLKTAGVPLLWYFAKMEQGEAGFALCPCTDQYSRTDAILFFKIEV